MFAVWTPVLIDSSGSGCGPRYETDIGPNNPSGQTRFKNSNDNAASDATRVTQSPAQDQR